MSLAESLRPLLRGEVLDDDTTLTAYSHDASLFDIRPQAVAYPQDAVDVGALVRYASEHPGVSLTPRLAGTDMSGGALSESVVVDLKRHFTTLVSVSGDTAVTQPGVYYRDFEQATLAQGLLLPPYPASRELCTVGGMAANNSGGEKSLRYGKTDAYVRRLKAVLADGNEYTFEPIGRTALDAKMAQQDFEGDLYRRMFSLVDGNNALLKGARPDVRKNSAGYGLWNVWDGTTFDMTKVLVGSQGTLGIITEITYKLVPKRKHAKLLVIFLEDLKPLPDIVNAVLKHDPESFESYDDHTMKFAFRYFGDIVRTMGVNAVALGFRFLPEAWMILTRGFPKLIMLAEFTGETEAEVDAAVNGAHEDLQRYGLPMRVTRTEKEAAKYWVVRRESFNLLRKHFKKMQTAPFIDDFCVQPARLPEFFPQLYDILNKYNLLLTVVGHVGDGNFHVIPIMDLSDEKTKGIIERLSKEVYDLVFRFGGSMTGEHNDGLIRGPFLKQMFGEEVYGLFEETKRVWDPRGVFNPGKKVGASLEYAMSKLKGQKPLG